MREGTPGSEVGKVVGAWECWGESCRELASGFWFAHDTLSHVCEPTCVFAHISSFSSSRLFVVLFDMGPVDPWRLLFQLLRMTRVSSRQGCAAEGPAGDRPGIWHQCIFAAPDKAHLLFPHQQHGGPDGSRRILARARGQGECTWGLSTEVLSVHVVGVLDVSSLVMLSRK